MTDPVQPLCFAAGLTLDRHSLFLGMAQLPVGGSMWNAFLYGGFAHFQHASSDNALSRLRANGWAADDLPPRLAEHQFDVARPDGRARRGRLALRRS